MKQAVCPLNVTKLMLIHNLNLDVQKIIGIRESVDLNLYFYTTETNAGANLFCVF